MITEEKIRELLEKVSKQKEEFTEKYVSLAKETEKLKNDHSGLIVAIQTLSDLTQSDEIKKTIEEKTKELNNVTDSYNKNYKILSDLERQVFSADGVVQCCLFILQEGEYAEEKDDNDKEDEKDNDKEEE